MGAKQPSSSSASSSSDDDDDADSRDEEISLAEARRPYQLAMMANHNEHNNSNNDCTKHNGGDANARNKQRRCAGCAGWMYCAQHCVPFMRLLLPHFGLWLFTIAYICAGAAIYQHVEGENEKMERVKLGMAIELAQRNLLVNLHNLAPHIPLDTLYQETEHFSQELLALGWSRGRFGQHLPAITTAQSGWMAKDGNIGTSSGGNGTGNSREGPLWSFVNSMLFATSLIARIGYGHLVPVTPLGKLLMFPFALFGIPLFLLTITDIGTLFARSCVRRHALCGRMAKKEEKRKKETRDSASNQQQQHIEHVENGSGEFAAVERGKRGHEMQQQERKNDDEMMQNDAANHCRWTTRLNNIKLLLFLAMAFLLLWALLALLYARLLELHWHWLDSFYFVFGTMYSIGFGDFAPSTELSTIVTICLIFPLLAFMSACIDAAASAYMRTIHLICKKLKMLWTWLGRKLMNRKNRRTRTTTKTMASNTRAATTTTTSTANNKAKSMIK